jgi:SAM-dependent methyltransferase
MTSTAGSGYVTDVEYTHNYCATLNPLRQRLALLAAGLAPPEPKVACELGFGQGLSVNIHAAASAVEWWGTDFNPAQAGFAQQLARLAGSDAKLFDQAFAEFCTRSDLPNFDVIGLHGIWSWISDENRAVLVDFIRRRLNVGGVLYLGYNTLPGWAAFAPIQYLIKYHNDMMSASGQAVLQRIGDAMAFAERLLGMDPLYHRANPKVIERLKAFLNMDRRYLAHEFLNANWTPMHVADMAKWLEPTKCSFACSANYSDHIDGLNLAADAQELLRGIPDSMFRETVRDFMINRWFRRDYWVKGARRLSPLEQAEALRRERVILTTHRPDVPSAIAGRRAKAQETTYGPILDVLADHRPRSLNEIERAVQTSQEGGVAFTQVVRAVLILAGANHLQPAADECQTEKFEARVGRLNTHLLEKVHSGAEILYLASAVTGGGVLTSRFEQLCLLARRNGCESPEDQMTFILSVADPEDLYLQAVKDLHLHFVKDGEMIEGRKIEAVEDKLAVLTTVAQAFAERRIPVLRALGIA